MTFRQPDHEKEASRFLDEYRKKTGRNIGPPVPIEQIVESLSKFDILYSSEELSADESGRIDFAQQLITVRDDETEERQRFSLAHEAGHLQLHSHTIDLVSVPIPGLFGDISRPHLSRRNSKEWHEVEANRFAAAVLMPLILLRPALTEAKDKFHYLSSQPDKLMAAVRAYLAAQFQVSIQAMEIRLKTSGLSAEIFTPRLF